MVSTFAGFDEFSGSVSLRSAMDDEGVGLFTVYHLRGSAQRTALLLEKFNRSLRREELADCLGMLISSSPALSDLD